jgi:hypothetical protein
VDRLAQALAAQTLVVESDTSARHFYTPRDFELIAAERNDTKGIAFSLNCVIKSQVVHTQRTLGEVAPWTAIVPGCGLEP